MLIGGWNPISIAFSSSSSSSSSSSFSSSFSFSFSFSFFLLFSCFFFFAVFPPPRLQAQRELNDALGWLWSASDVLTYNDFDIIPPFLRSSHAAVCDRARSCDLRSVARCVVFTGSLAKFSTRFVNNRPSVYLGKLPSQQNGSTPAESAECESQKGESGLPLWRWCRLQSQWSGLPL